MYSAKFINMYKKDKCILWQIACSYMCIGIAQAGPLFVGQIVPGTVQTIVYSYFL